MKTVNLVSICCLLLLAGLAFSGPAKNEIGKAAPAFSLPDQNGKLHSLTDYLGKYVVLEWTNPDCPFVKKHYNSKNMQNLQKRYTAKGVIWLSICSSAKGKQGWFEGKKLIRKLKSNRPMHTAYLIDKEGVVGKSYGAKTTPHMFVLNPKGELMYAGAIDDQPSTQVATVEKAHNYVAAALDESMDKKSVSISATAPYGCSVKY